MAKAPLRPALLGPPIIRSLSRINPGLAVAAAPQLPAALSQWIDWNRAVTLAAALDGRLADPAPAADGSALREEYAAVRQRLQAAIETTLGELTSTAVTPATLHKAVLGLQRGLQAASGRLRGSARDAVAAQDDAGARLAAVDAVMEQTLSPRETRLLERLPGCALANWSTDPDTRWPNGLPAPLQHDLRALLQAELDLRFQPVEGLLAALRPY